MRYQLTSCLTYSTYNLCKHNSKGKFVNIFSCSRFHSFQNERNWWSLLKFISQENPKKSQKNFACLLLNISDESYSHFLRYKYMWNDANIRVAVDGSANCLADKKIIHEADIVCGDFDSIRSQLLDQLRKPDALKLHGPNSMEEPNSIRMPQVIETPNQKETDFTKAIRVTLNKRPDILYFFGLYYSDGTRIDHIFALINTLHLIKKRIFLINIKSNTVSWLLGPGSHTIQKLKGRELCSLVPFTRSAEVKTQGLEYDMRHPTNLDFASLLSTSNMCKYSYENIAIDTDRELLWSIDLKQ